MLKDINNSIVLYLVKCFFKVEFQKKYFFLGFMAFVNIFKAPSKTILNIPRLDKSILVLMYKLYDHLLKSICQNRCDALESTINREIGRKSFLELGADPLGMRIM